jgi:hypothetical protein
VRVVATEAGDHEYELAEAAKIERIDWEAREQERKRTAAEAEPTNDQAGALDRSGKAP